jgi:hypothetical protein
MNRRTRALVARAAAAVVVAVAVVTGGAARAAAAGADVASQWNVVALEAGRALSPLMHTRALAMAHAAMFDAANGVQRRFRPYLVDERAAPGASAEAAVASAAHAVLAALYPDRQAALGAALTASLASIGAGPGRDAGVAFGRRIGGQVVARRQRDGALATTSHEAGTTPGAWRPTPPGELAPLAPNWGDVQPFLIAGAAAFAPPAPPAITSARYARDFAEVKLLGARDSARRTGDQTEAAVFWTAFSHHVWSGAARQAIARRPELSLVERARVFALLSGALADALIVGWRAKFAHRLWRPVTAIRLAASDGNDATEADPAWQPVIVTPPFPCYVSGHAIAAGAAQRALAIALGRDDADVTVTNPDVGVTRRYASFSQMADEVVEVRIWSGVHFRVSQEEGVRAGHGIGEAAARSRLQPLARD